MLIESFTDGMRKHTGLAIFILAGIMLTACSQKPALTIKDLRFAEYEKAAIMANRIDTTFFISTQLPYNYWGSDTFGITLYDSMGNMVYEEWKEFMGTVNRFEYDSNGLVIYKSKDTDYTAVFDAQYEFFPDSLLLKQCWSGMGFDTCFFLFDTEGKILEERKYASGKDPNGGVLHKKYEYNSAGLLSTRLVNKLHREQESERKVSSAVSTHNITKFYYTTTHLDSTVTTHYYPTDTSKNYTLTTLYDRRGLKTQTISMDTLLIKYVHRQWKI